MSTTQSWQPPPRTVELLNRLLPGLHAVHDLRRGVDGAQDVGGTPSPPGSFAARLYRPVRPKERR